MEHKVSTFIRNGLLAVTFIAIGIVGYLIYSSNEAYEKNSAANMDTIKDLQAQIEDVQVTQQTAEESKVVLNSARTLGSRIAELQNQWLQKRVAYYASQQTADTEAAYYEELDKISEELDTYFGEGSSFRGAWYTGDAETSKAAWMFCTNYSFTEDEVPVLWVCNNSDEVLMYVTGTYHVDTKIIDGLSSHMTLNGQSYHESSNDGDVDLSQDEIDEQYGNSILDLANSIVVPQDGKPVLTEEEQAQHDSEKSENLEAKDSLKPEDW